MSAYEFKIVLLVLSLILSFFYLYLNVKKEKNQGPTRKASFHRRKTWFFGFTIFLLTGIFISEQYFVSVVLMGWYLYIEYSYRKDLEKSVDNLQEMNLTLQKQKLFLEEKLDTFETKTEKKVIETEKSKVKLIQDSDEME